MPNNYLLDREFVSLRFDIIFFSPGLVHPFEFMHEDTKVTCTHSGRNIAISFIQELPKSLVEDIMWGRNSADAYVMGYMFLPLQKVNMKILEQKYSSGHFMLKTFSTFDILSIVLTNTDPEWADQIINVPWPPILTPPPHTHFISGRVLNLEVFIKDYVDAGTDLLRGEYDQCIRRLITSVENAVFYYGFRTGKFISKITLALPLNQTSIGQKNVLANIVFLYDVRNKITHDLLRISPENGWWLCAKAMKTVQYFYQYIDTDRSEAGNGAYAFRTWAFVEQVFLKTKGRILEHDRQVANSIEQAQNGDATLLIDNDEDFNRFMYEMMLITDDEKNCIVQNRPRESM